MATRLGFYLWYLYLKKEIYLFMKIDIDLYFTVNAGISVWNIDISNQNTDIFIF